MARKIKITVRSSKGTETNISNLDISKARRYTAPNGQQILVPDELATVMAQMWAPGTDIKITINDKNTED